MELKTLSASAAQVYETCPARFKAQYVTRTPDIAGEAGSLGSACHEALEMWVSTGQHLADWPTVIAKEKAMMVVWQSVYYDYFKDESHFSEGWKMLAKWVQTIDWSGRTVISTEQKESFPIPTSKGDLQFNYIIDRLDQLPSGDYEVVDYKTVIQPISVERLRSLIQTRVYALAVRIKYQVPADRLVWVTYDLLRYSRVSCSFTRDDCVRTYNYLKYLAERIFADDGTQEKLNAECRFCVRKHACDTLLKHGDGGGVLGINSLEEATERRAVIDAARAAQTVALAEIDELILAMARQENVHEWESPNFVAGVTAKGQRNVDSERVSQLVGPHIMAKYGKVGVGILEEIIKNEELPDNVMSQLKQMLSTKVYGSPYIYTKPKTPFED